MQPTVFVILLFGFCYIYGYFSLDCAKFNSKHTGENIAKLLMEIMEEQGIKDRVWFMVTDGAAPMLKASRDLNKLFLANSAEDVSLEADDEEDFSENDEEFDAIEEGEAEAEELENALSLLYDHKDAMAGLSVTRIPCVAHKVIGLLG